MIKKVLIANRGEIAVRVIRSCQELDIDTVSIYSTADENSLHAKVADESVCIGPPAATKSYLNYQAVLTAAEITGADSIHPGYGFLSENSEFAQMCFDCGINFIGPSPEIIKKMGNKIESKEIAKLAHLPVLDSITINEVNSELKEKINEMGFPILIKAASGGGGRGMQIIRSFEGLEDIVKRLKQESKLAFGDDTLFVEKYIENPRHIEVQIVGDKHGNLIHLGERDCTVQRNYQKVIEEAPSQILSAKERKTICEAAVNLGKYINYDSVGTVEFLYDLDEKKFYFIEMNTRIQVEHPVTEMITGVDLVALQIEIAMNKKLSYSQSDISFNGHSIECRINAEDPDTFMPSPGEIVHYHRPGGLGVRVDDFIYTGYKIPHCYDSMVSKVIAHSDNREKCIKKMQRAVSEMILSGIKSNIDLHKKVLSNKEFHSGNYSTKFLKLI